MTEYQQYRQSWFDAANNMIAPDVPIHIDLELTKICNLKCAMCPSSKQKSGGVMDLDLAKRTLKQASDIGVKSVKMNWRGEPTLHPNFVEISRYAHSLNFVDIMLNTNGMYANRNVKTALFNDYTTVVFSIDAFDIETFKACRAGSIPELIFHNLGEIEEFRAEHGKPKFIVVNLVRQRQNWNEYEIIKTMCRRKGVRFRAMLAFPRTDEEHLHYADHIPKVIGRQTCSFPFQRLTIGYDGKVYPCCCIWDDDNDICLGDVNYYSLKDIWMNDRIVEIRESEKQNPLIKANPVCDKKCVSWLTYETGKPTLFNRYEK